MMRYSLKRHSQKHQWSPPWRSFSFCLISLIFLNCSSPKVAENSLRPAFSESRESQESTERWTVIWENGSRDIEELIALLNEHLERFPQDASSRRARVYLGFLLLKQGRIDETEKLIQGTETKTWDGAERDMDTVLQAAIALAKPDPKTALKKIETVSGKLIDPEWQDLALEIELAAAKLEKNGAVLARSWSKDIAVQHQHGVNLDGVILQRRSEISTLPDDALKDLAKGLNQRQRNDLEEEVRDAMLIIESEAWAALGERALQTRDEKLAMTLLTEGRISPKMRGDLQNLTSEQSQSPPRLIGRRIGVMMEIGTSEGRTRSNALSTGIEHVLRQHLDEHIEIEYLPFSEDDDDSAFSEILHEGISVLIGGVTSSGAERLSRLSHRFGIPVVVLQASTDNFVPCIDGFASADPFEEERRLLSLDTTIVDHLYLEYVETPLPGSRNKSCPSLDEPDVDWPSLKKGEVLQLILKGSSRCARSLLTDRLRPTSCKIKLGVEASASAQIADRGSQYLQSGAYPFTDETTPVLGDFITRYGSTPSWFAALGHDTTILLIEALKTFPHSRKETDLERIKEGYQAMHAAIKKARSRQLWTTTLDGFDRKCTLAHSWQLKEWRP